MTTDLSNTPLYLGFIFDPQAADGGIVGDAVVHSDLEELKAILKQSIDNSNDDCEDFSKEDFDWYGLTYAPEGGSENYGGYVWGRIEHAYIGTTVHFSEYN